MNKNQRGEWGSDVLNSNVEQMLSTLRLIPVLLVAATAPAATLVQLSMDQMTQNSTAIVRARIVGSTASLSTTPAGSVIYTHYRMLVSEVWKGTAPADFVLPGGDIGTQKQSFPGVPDLKVGNEYVLFLWTSPSTGIVHTIGLTQGIFDVTTQIDGSVMAGRRQTGELMLDASGRRVADQAVSMKVGDMKARVRTAGAIQ